MSVVSMRLAKSEIPNCNTINIGKIVLSPGMTKSKVSSMIVLVTAAIFIMSNKRGLTACKGQGRFLMYFSREPKEIGSSV